MTFLLEIIAPPQITQGEEPHEKFVTLDSSKTEFNVKNFEADFIAVPSKVIHRDYFEVMIEDFVDSIDTSHIFGKGYPVEGLEKLEWFIEEDFLYLEGSGSVA